MYPIVRFFNQKLNSPEWVLLFVIVFTIAYFVIAHEGFYWIDDYGYAKYAWEVMDGSFSITQNTESHPNNPLTHRVMTFAPVALFFKLFGVNIYAATLWPLLCTIGSSLLIFILFRKENNRIAVAAMILLGLYFHTLFLGSYLYSDNLIMFFAFAAVAVLYRFRYQATGGQPVLYAFLFVLVNFAAYLTKETILYYAPFYLWLFVSDVLQKKHYKFWVAALIFGIIFLGANFIYYHFRTGDWLFRFHLYEQSNVNYQTDGEEHIPVTGILRRLTYLPFLFFIGTGIMVPFILAFGLLRHNSFLNLLSVKTRDGFWFMLVFLVLLQLWFGSTAYSFYKPLPMIPRFFTVMMPPLCICAGIGLTNFFRKDKKVATFYLLAFLASCLADRSNTLIMHLLLAAYFAWNWWKFRQPKYEPSFAAGMLVLILVLSLRPLHFMRKPSLMSFQEETAIVKTYLNGQTGRNLVLGDKWQNFMYDFHYKFEPNPHYTYKEFKQAGTETDQYDRVYLLLNRSNLSNPDMAKWQIVEEPEINQLFPEKQLVVQRGNVLLYRIK